MAEKMAHVSYPDSDKAWRSFSRRGEAGERHLAALRDPMRPASEVARLARIRNRRREVLRMRQVRLP